MGQSKFIEIRGARQHNLKDISLRIPRDRLTVITGLSGSGKSSLAFDTLYAEGQRRYVESLSTYARQFLEQMQKPDVDHIEGLPPTVAIEQRAGSSNPRSTVATTTEVYDYLRTLFARVGMPHCWKCHRPIARRSVAEIVDAILETASGETVTLLAPLVRRRRGRHADVLRSLRKEGLVRIRLNGEIVRLDEDPEVPPKKMNNIEAVVDRITAKQSIRPRIADSVELALRLGDGVLILARHKQKKPLDQVFSSRYACTEHLDVVLPELTPRLFGFNSPFGACPKCDGLGTVPEFDENLLIANPDRSLAQGAIDPWRQGSNKVNTTYQRLLRSFCNQFEVAIDAPYRNLPDDIQRILIHGTSRADKEKWGAEFEGVIPSLRRRWDGTQSETVKRKLHAYLSDAPCETCHGSRLRAEARAVLISEQSMDQVVRMDIQSALEWVRALRFKGERAKIAAPLLAAIETRLRFMAEVGVGYLTLDRGSATLSGGEAQRIRLATQIGTGMVGVCYILDEPTVGLHSRDSAQLVRTMHRLRDMGNTVIVVEHDEEVIAAADHIVDMGPGAGEQGGHVIAQGTLGKILKDKNSITGRYLSRKEEIEIPERRAVDLAHALEIRGARENNLADIDVRFPLGCFVCITGVSGSGKSTLVNDILLRALKRRLYASRERPGDYDRLAGGQDINKVIEIDQSPIGRTPRSNPATYVGAFDLVRQLYAKTREAKIRGYSPSRFSFNVKGGRCEACQGQGTKRIEMHFLPDIYVTCEACKGTRYSRETLEIRYRARNIAEVLDMRVNEARTFFDSFPKIKRLLQTLSDVGMGYITLGQASTTLSGGEAQRIKLAAELGKAPSDHTLYILDEPTTGLHYADVRILLRVLNRLVDQGNTVLVIEHNLDVIKIADWVIDLGPEGGAAGGKVVAAGTPEDIMAVPESYTGQYLNQRASGKKRRTPRRPTSRVAS
ncbi:MAG: excinuclease ABC subunit UvrA [Planctomycetota bacterium]|nr:excinuclease ABC subunit UvrA [Planctomycetota bacterium]